MFHTFVDEYRGNLPDVVLRRAREALEYVERVGSPVAQAQSYWVLARPHLAAKDAAAAREACDQSLVLPFARDSEPSLLAVLAEAQLAETGARAQAPFLIEERARLAVDLGAASTSAWLLREAHRQFTEMGATDHAQRLAAEIAA